MIDQPMHTNHSEGNIEPILKYLPNNTIYLNMRCILTLTKTLKIGMPYLFQEGQHTFPIRLLRLWHSDGFVYLSIQNWLSQVYKISWTLQEDIEYCLWAIASLDYLMDLAK
jgi:hypothetical protein